MSIKTNKTLRISGWTPPPIPKHCENCERLDHFDNECMEFYEFAEAEQHKRRFIKNPKKWTCVLWTDDKNWERR